ncbi:Eco57I restriction-modification methylase domain-containing protein [Planktothrix agardhii]|uniref:Eco57I restriction-modification methylase domain-containing protein n=1 Tax=Planktothrix agardhii TaxID=1160 RepID=UPI00041340B6|nr:N-6 DNA methylase [Planktothrix agardhii]
MVTNLLPTSEKLPENSVSRLIAIAVLFAWLKQTEAKGIITEYSKELCIDEITHNKTILEALSVLADDLKESVIKFLVKNGKNLAKSLLTDEVLLGNQVSFFNKIGAEILSSSDSRQLGAVFTPPWLSEYVSKSALNYWQEIHKINTFPERVADFSCGPGTFLFQLSQLLNTQSYIYGKDISPEIVCLARLGTMEKTNINIDLGDSLLDHINTDFDLFDYLENPNLFDIGKDIFNNYDIIVGNPPYVRSQNISSQYANSLKKAYPKYTSGNFDLVTLFLVQSLDALKPNGVAALIVSSKFMTSKYGSAVCQLLASQARVIEIVNFGDSQVFDGKTTYTCIIIFAKQPKSKSFKVINFPSGTKWEETTGKIALAEANELSTDRLLWHPWDLSDGLDKQIINTIRNNSKIFITNEFADICQGIRTGMNQAYVLSEEELEAVESALIFPFVSGRNIRRCSMLPPKEFIIWPYQLTDFNTTEIIPPSLMQEQYPKTWQYLQRYQADLSNRALDRGLPWYAFSRNQNLESQTRPKILVKEMMSRSEFVADEDGRYKMGSGYALIAPQGMSVEVLKMWSAILSTPTMEFQLRLTGTQLHSGWFRLLKHHLERIQLPSFNSTQKKLAIELSSKIYENPENNEAFSLLDDLVSDSFQLSTSMRQHIEEYLIGVHKISRSSNKLDKSKSETCKDVNYITETAYPDLTSEQRKRYLPAELPQYNKRHIERKDLSSLVTFKPNKKVPIHRWYNYTQGYSGKLVESLLKELEVSSSALVYDPFAGSGTTLLSCRKLGFASVGVEISPLMVWIAKQKVKRWDSNKIRDAAAQISSQKKQCASNSNLLFQEYFNKAYDPEILEQIIGWRNWIQDAKLDEEQKDFLTLALLCILEEVSLIRKHGSHYRFLNNTDSVGLEKLNTPTIAFDADIQPILIRQIEGMIRDVEITHWHTPLSDCNIYCGDSLSFSQEISNIDVVITSPPYLNRNNYIAQQKAEISLLELLPSYDAYRDLVRKTFRSHVESNLSGKPETSIAEIQQILDQLELTDNNNPKIPQMIAGYFEDLKRTLQVLSQKVKSGGYVAFVVGNSRWGGVVVPVDHLLAMLAESCNFSVEQILVTRMKGNSPQQMKRYGRVPVRESIVIIRKL